jgi:uncharacterized iron-regulated membrane protein
VKWHSIRNGLRQVHLWAGLILALPFILLGISGSILMFQPEVPRWSLPHASAVGEHQSLEAIVGAARAALPGARATRLTLPDAPGEPATIRFNPTEAQDAENYRGDLVFVDPVSLQILGTIERPRNPEIFNFMRTLHATLYVRTMSDRSFVGWMGIALIVMCITGLILWWPKKGRGLSALGVSQGARGFRLFHDLHAAFGFWSLIVLLVVSVSGLYLAFPRTFRDAVGTLLPIGQFFEEPASNDVAVLDPAGNLDQAVARTLDLVPQVELRDIQLATRPGGVTVFALSPSYLDATAPEITVSFDTDTGEVVYIDDPRAYAPGERVVLWQRWLHSGLGLGMVWRVLVFISGFLPLFFAVTGTWMWILKRRQRAKLKSSSVPAAAE